MNVQGNDLHNVMVARRVIAPATIGPNATKTGKVIDRLGYYGVEFVSSYGAVTTTGTNIALVVLEGDVTGTMTSAADVDLLGTEALASLLATTPRTSGVSQNVCKRVGYKGIKRYVSVNAVQTGTSSAGAIDVSAILFNPGVAPTSNP